VERNKERPNIRLEWEWLALTNILSYYTVKDFIAHAAEGKTKDNRKKRSQNKFEVKKLLFAFKNSFAFPLLISLLTSPS
jgi:hypothetical protein